METFPEKLAAALETRGLSAWEAARRMREVSYPSIRNLLSGRTPPWNVRVNTMHELCRVLGLSPRDFRRPARG